MALFITHLHIYVYVCTLIFFFLISTFEAHMMNECDIWIFNAIWSGTRHLHVYEG